jgi:hypothetical protein
MHLAKEKFVISMMLTRDIIKYATVVSDTTPVSLHNASQLTERQSACMHI